MDKKKMLQMAERNLYKAKLSLRNNQNRSGVTKQEIANLNDKVEFAQLVYDLIIGVMM